MVRTPPGDFAVPPENSSIEKCTLDHAYGFRLMYLPDVLKLDNDDASTE